MTKTYFDFCNEQSHDVLDKIIEKKGLEIIGPRIQDYIYNILMLSYCTGVSVDNIIKNMKERNEGKILELSNAIDNILIKNWWEKTYVSSSDNEKDEVILFLESILNELYEILKNKNMEIFGYTMGYIAGVINNDKLTCEEKIKNISDIGFIKLIHNSK